MWSNKPSIVINFKYIKLDKIKNYKEWLTEYKSDIRCSVNWGKLKKITVKSIIVNKEKIYLPDYGKDSWQDGKPKQFKLGKNWTIVKVPAVKYKNKYFVLDGCHRLTELKPMLVILDYLDINSKQAKYFTDLYNKELK